MDVRVSPRSNDAARCGYCHDTLRDARPSACPACAATYHEDCAEELSGRCGTRGCAKEVVRASALRVVARAAVARHAPRRGWVLAALLLGLIVVGLPLTAAVMAAREREAARAETEAAAAAEVAGRLGYISAVAQSRSPTPEELDRARRLYLELHARGLVDRTFVSEQVRRGNASSGVYYYPGGVDRRDPNERVDAITR